MGVTELVLTPLELIPFPYSPTPISFTLISDDGGIDVKLPDVTVSLVARSLCGRYVTHYSCDAEYVLEEADKEGCNE
ncbi:hypothetical protein [Halomontanus rarus]|uniref:hypothetical protein n=1 Tax=Halomontanus rarus TaxID=3034020 RepID=UPI001A9A1BAC